ncbi:hypothetical protein SDC9_198691 [bioreactor metagenome]|uniref:Uncharacterized protein n=1 Tax=bioreactor metagenome TaxID=1076179 RepID=A0A645IIV0_9ZZZZ
MILLGKNDAVDIVGEQIDHRLFFRLTIVVVVGNQRLVVMVGRHRFDTGKNVGEELVLKGGNEHAKRVALRVQQHGWRTVRDVVDLLHDLRDTLASFLCDLFR